MINAMGGYLTSDQILLLKKSFRHLDANQFAAQFYMKLFELHPEVKSMFPTDMEELKTKLMSVFELVVFSFEEKKSNQFGLQEAVIVPLRELGRLHEKKGVIREHYKLANDLLIQTLQEEAADILTPEVEYCWRFALHQLTDCMLDTSSISEPLGVSLIETFREIMQRIRKQINA